MITYLNIALGLIALGSAAMYACGGSDEGRQTVGGTGDTPVVTTEQSPSDTDGTDADDGATDEGTDDGTDDGTDGDPDPEPVVKEVGFSCGPGQVKFKIDDKPVDAYAAAEFPTVDNDDTTNNGLFPYEVPGSPDLVHSISFFASGGDKKPGDIFGGWVSINRGADGKAVSCPDKAAENYIKYIDGSAAAPFSRHFEGVIVNLYKDQDCTGDVVIKKFSFCISAVNPE